MHIPRFLEVVLMKGRQPHVKPCHSCSCSVRVCRFLAHQQCEGKFQFLEELLPVCRVSDLDLECRSTSVRFGSSVFVRDSCLGGPQRVPAAAPMRGVLRCSSPAQVMMVVTLTHAIPALIIYYPVFLLAAAFIIKFRRSEDKCQSVDMSFLSRRFVTGLRFLARVAGPQSRWPSWAGPGVARYKGTDPAVGVCVRNFTDPVLC